MNGALRAIERGEETVTGRVHLTAAIALEQIADPRLPGLEEVAPFAVAEVGGARRRGDDVGEQHRRQHAIGLDGGSAAGDELLDRVEDRILVTDEPEMIRAG